MEIEQEIETLRQDIKTLRQNFESEILKIREFITDQLIINPSEESTDYPGGSFYYDPSEESSQIHSESFDDDLIGRMEVLEKQFEELKINLSEQSFNDQQNKFAKLSKDLLNLKVALAKIRRSMTNYIDEETVIEIIEETIQNTRNPIDEIRIREIIIEIQNTQNYINKETIREIIDEKIQQMLCNLEEPIDGEMTQRMLCSIQSPINEETIQRMIKNISYIMVRFNQLSKKRQNLDIEIQNTQDYIDEEIIRKIIEEKIQEMLSNIEIQRQNLDIEIQRHNLDIELQRQTQISRKDIILTVFLTCIALQYLKYLLTRFLNPHKMSYI